ncbi:MAG: glycosyltransferase family 2 protein [Candidatus Gracilibacteria bacterium]|jgi:glycosyltransferase involved in cell wall biosynthesis
MPPYISVIIPTFNRAEKLIKCLACLKNQTLAREAFEVIVINDGSTDGTEALLKTWQKNSQKSNFNLKFSTQKNSGQGTARNKGIKEAGGLITLFIGDDIYAKPNLLELHTVFHKKHPEENMACLGLIEWTPTPPPTPFMHWLTHGGPQFAYDLLTDKAEADFWFFYTSNISLKTGLLRKEHFDPDFKSYGWEDTELAYRLVHAHNLKILFNKDALAFHDHIVSEDSLKNRMMGIGKNAVIFQKKHPKLPVVPQGLKLAALKILSSLPALLILKVARTLSPNRLGKYYWYSLSKRYFLKGLKSL